MGKAMHIQMFKDSDTGMVFTAGARIFSEGDDPAGLMFVVVDGEVDILAKGALVDTIGPGSCLGEVGLVDKGPRTATAVARTDCRLEPIDARRFEFMVQQTPYFALEMLETLAARLRRERAL